MRTLSILAGGIVGAVFASAVQVSSIPEAQDNISNVHTQNIKPPSIIVEWPQGFHLKDFARNNVPRIE